MSDQTSFGFDVDEADVVLRPPPATAPVRSRRTRSKAPAEHLPGLAPPPPPPERHIHPITATDLGTRVFQASSQLERLFNGVASRKGRDIYRLFTDWLDVCCSTLLADEGRYQQAIAPYTPVELDLFAQAFALLLGEVQCGYHDIVGPTFERLGLGNRNDQFFTPWHVAHMMAQMTCSGMEPKPDGKPITIIDPTCGAGVMLLAAAQVIEEENPALLAHVEFYGTDISATCCKMAELNMLSHGLMQRGRVVMSLLTAPERARAEQGDKADTAVSA